jgi:hypothetical protein
VADHQPAQVARPGECPLDRPPPLVTPEFPPVLQRRPRAVLSVRADELDVPARTRACPAGRSPCHRRAARAAGRRTRRRPGARRGCPRSAPGGSPASVGIARIPSASGRTDASTGPEQHAADHCPVVGPAPAVAWRRHQGSISVHSSSVNSWRRNTAAPSANGRASADHGPTSGLSDSP